MSRCVDVAYAEKPRGRAWRWAFLLGAVAIAACGGEGETGPSTDGGVSRAGDAGASTGGGGGGGGASVCTSFTYTPWGPCQSSGTQTRTVTSSSPAACTGGNPVLSQSCTPTVDGSALYQARCANNCHGALASSDLRGKGVTVESTQAKHKGGFGLTAAQLLAIVAAIGP